MKKTITRVLGFAAAAATFVSAGQVGEQVYHLEIPPAPLLTALSEFSRQTGMSISVLAPGQGEGFRLARHIKGDFTLNSALDEIVTSNGLSYVRVNQKTIAVLPKKNAVVLKSRPAFVLAKLDEEAKPASYPGVRSRSTRSSTENAERNIEVVTVTAQKREEALQDVPISISVMGGDELDTSTAEGFAEVLGRVPGVATTLNVQGGGSQITMRGVTASGPVFEGSSPVAYYLDSVPVGLIKSAIVPDSNAYDLDHVEVLRGPQGTLYGASALNGVVRVLTSDADLENVEFKARTLGSQTEDGGDNYRADMAVNVPILPGKLAARAVVGYDSFSGWIDRPAGRDANDALLRNLRLKINSQPTEELSIGLSAWRARNDYGAPSTSADGLTNANPLSEPMYTDYDTYGLNIGYEFTGMSLSSMTSYLQHENGGDLDLTLFFGEPMVLFTGFESEIVSQELVLRSSGTGNWRWSAGAFYRKGEDRLLQLAPYLPAPTDYSDTSESAAIFGELGSRLMGGKLEWTAGLRYFHDDVTSAENVQSQGLTDLPLYEASDTFTSTTPRVTLTWHLSDEASVYGSYSHGFRSGFPQNAKIVQQAPGFPPLKPDKLKNYEVGMKGSWLDQRLTLDSSVYYIDWEDVQQTLRVDINGVPASAPVNGEAASGFGTDIAVMLEPLIGLQLGMNVSWNDLTWNNARFFDGALLFDEGERLNYSPEYTFGTFLDYLFPIALGGLEVRLSSSANYTSKQTLSDFSAGARVIESGDDMLIARANVSVGSANQWTVSLFGDNLTNEGGTAVYSAYGVPDWSPRVRPRTIGLQLDYRLR